MEPTRRNWTAEAVTTPENHEAWTRRFVADPASMTGVIVLDLQAAPGQPIPKELEPEEPKPGEE